MKIRIGFLLCLPFYLSAMEWEWMEENNIFDLALLNEAAMENEFIFDVPELQPIEKENESIVSELEQKSNATINFKFIKQKTVEFVGLCTLKCQYCEKILESKRTDAFKNNWKRHLIREHSYFYPEIQPYLSKNSFRGKEFLCPIPNCTEVKSKKYKNLLNHIAGSHLKLNETQEYWLKNNIICPRKIKLHIFSCPHSECNKSISYSSPLDKVIALAYHHYQNHENKKDLSIKTMKEYITTAEVDILDYSNLKNQKKQAENKKRKLSEFQENFKNKQNKLKKEKNDYYYKLEFCPFEKDCSFIATVNSISFLSDSLKKHLIRIHPDKTSAYFQENLKKIKKLNDCYPCPFDDCIYSTYYKNDLINHLPKHLETEIKDTIMEIIDSKTTLPKKIIQYLFVCNECDCVAFYKNKQNAKAKAKNHFNKYHGKKIDNPAEMIVPMVMPNLDVMSSTETDEFYNEILESLGDVS